jgi:hypothetical protein
MVEVEMKVAFMVAGVRKGHVGVNAMVNDVSTRALVDGMEVELVTDGGRSFTLPVYGADLTEAETLFVPNGKVTFTIEGAGE